MQHIQLNPLNYYVANRLTSSIKLKSGTVILGFDGFLVKMVNDKPAGFSRIFPVKSVAELDEKHFLAGTSSFVFKIRTADLTIIDTIWRERCTKLYVQDKKIYIGTVKGLFELNENKTSRFLGDLHPTLSRRITDIKHSADGTLWVSSSDNGIVALRNGKITFVLKDSNGLSSNICRALFIRDHFLWVGTNKGLNKVDVDKPGGPVLKYSISDGLPNNNINCINVDDSLVWIGTAAGLTYFNEANLSQFSMCKLNLLKVIAGRTPPSLDTSYTISWQENNLQLEYVAVSHKSGGEMTYYYRINGLQNEWQSTTQTSLNFESLPGGDFDLELYAVNKYGVKSETKRLHVKVEIPFWKQWWFYILSSIFILGAVILYLQKRNRRNYRKLIEKNKTQQQFAALEQQALQAQMNPHFIFNCLNSIQQYIVTNDKEKANRYLTGFASLVRQTLDYSGKKNITVAEETKYLKQYIEMEKMRFGDNFSYSILIEDTVQADFAELPALLLQPYVENALRHGLRYKEEGTGILDIRFAMTDGKLMVTITDNGVGRKRAAELKSKQHIEYQSKGMSLAQKRMELLNKTNIDNIHFSITDLTDQHQQPAGTKIELIIPQ